jgi:hypothetical protein
MPYGCISEDMRKYIEKRAKEGNVFERFTLEPALCETPEICELAENCLCFIPGIMTVSIIIEGALDEEFEIQANGYEANIADWIAEKLDSEKIRDYWVLVSDCEGNTVYSTETGI